VDLSEQALARQIEEESKPRFLDELRGWNHEAIRILSQLPLVALSKDSMLTLRIGRIFSAICHMRGAYK
jgi:hypothetical protein